MLLLLSMRLLLLLLLAVLGGQWLQGLSLQRHHLHARDRQALASVLRVLRVCCRWW